MMTTVAVIQARSGSTRFPGKVLALLQGRPMLEHIIERVSRAELVDRVVIATTDSSSDDDVAALALACGAGVTRGPEDDVLTRYLLAAREHDAAVIVRITADCPLVDPAVVDLVIRTRAREEADYASNVAPPTFPDGYDVEVLTADCLHHIDRDAVIAYEREHVTVRVREHPDDFRTAQLRNDRDVSWMRLTVDVPTDLDRIARVLAALPATPPPGLAEVVAAYERDPALHEGSLPLRDERYHLQRDAAQQTARAEESRPA